MRRTLIALVSALGLFLPPAPTQAQTDGTGIFAGAHGMTDGVQRGFTPTGGRFVGLNSIGFVVIELDTIDHAKEATLALTSNIADFIAAAGTAGALRPASIRDLGDQTIARAGTITSTSKGTSTETMVAVIGYRSGRFVSVCYGDGKITDPLLELAGIAEKLIDRTPKPKDAPLNNDGLRQDGLWNMLPTLHDVPEGFVVDNEAAPRQGTPTP